MGSLVKGIVDVFKDGGLEAVIEQTIPDDATAALLWWKKNEGVDGSYVLDLDTYIVSGTGLSDVKYSIEKKKLHLDAEYTMSAKASLTPWREIEVVERDYSYQGEAIILTKATFVARAQAEPISILPPGGHPERNMKVVFESETSLLSMRMFVDEIVKHCAG